MRIYVECLSTSNNVIRLLRNFPISFGVVSVMQLRMLSIIVVKLILDLFMLANLLKFLRAFILKYMCNGICSAFRQQADFLYKLYKCVYLSQWISISQCQ